MYLLFRHTDGGQRLAMAGWEGEQDSVDNKVVAFNAFTTLFTIAIHVCQIPAIAHFYATVYGDEEEARNDATIADLETLSKAPSSRRFGEVWIQESFCHSDQLLVQRVGFGGDQQSLGRQPTPRSDLSFNSRQQFASPEQLFIVFQIRRKSDKCSDCPDRDCLSCPAKKRGSNSKCSDCSSVKSKGSDIKAKEKKSWWPLRPFSFWPTTKQQGEEKEGKVSSRAVWKRN